MGQRRLFGRLHALRLIAVAVFVALIGRLWYIQTVRGAELRGQAEDNRFAVREIPADRGVIYDASGRQVVVNSARFTVGIVPGALARLELAERERVLRRVAEVVGRPLRARKASPRLGATGPRDDLGAEEDEVVRAMFGARRSIESFLPRDGDGQAIYAGWHIVTIDRNVPRARAFELMEESAELPGVIVDQAPVREYPAGPTLAHALGFTGSIVEDALDDYLARGYRIYDSVGRSGLEATYEDVLKGSKGERIVQVDVHGREMDEVAIARPPSPGANLHLTLDLALQEAAEGALAAGLRRVGARSGAIVALDPRDGAVRAMVTLPNYDNNMFSTGASPDAFVALLGDPDRPLINRAIASQPPGSVFKLITASAALQEGVIDRATQIVDPGVIVLPNQYDPSIEYSFPCWLRSGHGAVNVVQALAHSCDVFFYEVAGGYYERGADQAGLGSERLADYAERFGLGRPSEIELLGESEGHVPTAGWLQEYNGEYWGTGNTYHMGIGQGHVLATPLQMANMTAAVANGGTLYRPHLVARIDAGAAPMPNHELGGVLDRLPVDPGHLEAVREGMLGAVRYGTSRPDWTGLPSQVTVAGKTGTAEICDWVSEGNAGYCRRDPEGHLLTHAWFIAFAPYEAPEIALAVFVSGAGLDRIIEGSQVAAPIAADVLRTYFDLPPRPGAAPAEDEEDVESVEGEAVVEGDGEGQGAGEGESNSEGAGESDGEAESEGDVGGAAGGGGQGQGQGRGDGDGEGEGEAP